MQLKSFTCEQCGQNFERRNGKRIYRFCSRTCTQLTIAPGNRGYRVLAAKWLVEYGEDRTIEMLAEHMRKRVAASIATNTGRTLSESSRKKIATSCAGIPNSAKGKTFVELYGAQRACELSQQHSDVLKAGYASGRIKPTARSRSAPTFRGVRLRSRLEQSAIEMLEQRDDLEFGVDLLYEHPSTFVTWTDRYGIDHTYVPDLLDVKNDIVYEVKPAWQVANPTDDMLRKMIALGSTGRKHAYLTDTEIARDLPRRA